MSNVIDAAIPMIALALIERYGNEASAHVANRARLLETCGDRQTSRTWRLIGREIDEFETYSSRRYTRSSNEDRDSRHALLKRAVRQAA